LLFEKVKPIWKVKFQLWQLWQFKIMCLNTQTLIWYYFVERNICKTQ
jgi:hypothetical protein